jgi:hypothetical protein
LLPIDIVVKMLIIVSNLPTIALNSEALVRKGVMWKFISRWWTSFAQPLWMMNMSMMGIVGVIINTDNWLGILAVYITVIPVVVGMLFIWLRASIFESTKDLFGMC